MSIRDLVSNNVLTQAVAPQTLNNSGVNSASIDLSEGTTGAIQILLDSAAAASVTLLLEKSDDDITFVTDDGSTGNGFVDANGDVVASPVVSPVDKLIIAQIVNPQGNTRFHRVVLTETATQAVEVAAIGWVGPKRFVDPEA